MNLKKTTISLIFASSIFSYGDSNYVSIIDKKDNSYISDPITPPLPPEKTYNTIPAMTGYTNSLGTAIAKSEYNHSDDYYPAWRGFDQLNSSHYESWLGQHNVTTNQWIGFIFNEPKEIKETLFFTSKTYPYGTAKNVFIEYSDNGNDWFRASLDFTIDNSHTNEQTIPVTEKNKHTHWRLFAKDNFGGSNHAYFIAVGDINFRFVE